MIPVTDLKQWVYCPRVVYYHRLMPTAGVMTHKMREALRAQDWLEHLELRRSLKKYGFEHARRRFGVWLSDSDLGLSGRVDMLLQTPDSATIVDFKLTSGPPADNHKMQLAGYALLVHRVLHLPVATAFLLRIPDSTLFEIPITPAHLEHAIQTTRRIQEMAESQLLPDPASNRHKCADCEYANFCADVW
ncbi:MAG: CRISPR-associated exonuclease Cas4 [Bryobacteraceae bacterium]|nr:CRISPR-associated exonuclease Cas4 [Bryobacteraceae bacterium]